jgi:hypothetical protein
VPRIADQFLECVVYIYPDVALAEAGESTGGTGFLIGVPLNGFGNAFVLFVVTNWHNIHRGGRAVRFNTNDGHIETVEIEEPSWIRHPEGDDLAIAAVGLSADHVVYRYVGLDQLISTEIINAHNIGPGDDVFVVGRFVHHDGKQRNLPSVRFGNIAQMPGEKIRFPDGHEQESFLVEARSIAGYSGSPVFIQIPRWSSGAGRFNTNWGYGPWLLGIDHCHLSANEPVREKPLGKPVNPNWYVNNNTGMMGVIPAWRLAEMFNLPQPKAIMADAHAEATRRFKNENSEAVRDLNADPS